jgi:hypothetical protein
MVSCIKKLFKRAKTIKTSKKGVSGIELAIGSLVAIVVFSALLDYLIIANRSQAMSSTMTYVSKTLANQSCVASSISKCGSGYVTSYIKNKKFVTTSQLYSQIKSIMDSERIPESQWTVLVGTNPNNLKAIDPTNNPNIGGFGDYGTRIYVEIRIQYRWQTLSSYIPGNAAWKTMSSRQSILSVYKIRDKDANSTGFQYGV